jgi:hypothetical protein
MSALRLSVCLAAFLLLLQPAAAQQSRVALVIGNARYAEAPLKNPVNDARAMAAALKARGFEVLFRENATKAQMESAVADFGEKLNEGSTGLFFYAGHGVQVQGRNYLLPVDARIVSEQRMRLEAFDVEAVLDQMQAARSKVSMVILDACRNNPFERRFRSTGAGLAQLNAPEGTLIAYATAPGKVAADGDGNNGLYTQEFLKALATPGLKVEDVFKQVRINVSRASDGTQVPWEASSLTGDFYFVPPAPVAAPAAPSLDQAFWNAVKDSNTPASLQAYLDTFPTGMFAVQARAQLVAIGNRPAGAALAAPAVKGFDGRYNARVSTQSGILDLVIDVKDTAISGFTTSAQGALIGARSGICRLSGSIQSSGLIERLALDCPYASGSFTGRFALDDKTRTASAATVLRGTEWNTTEVIWTRGEPRHEPNLTQQATVPAITPTVLTAPPTAAVPPAPARLVQQASLPSAGAPVTSGTFDGLYTSAQNDRRGMATSTIEISGTTITGFSTNSGATGICRASGSIDAVTGEVQRFEMTCPINSMSYAGRFTGGDTELTTRSTVISGEHKTLWRKTQSAVQRAALSPAGAPLPAGAIDGRYTAVLPSIDGLPMTMSIDVANHRITGWGTAPSITGVCRLFGTVDASGVIQRLEMDCRLAGWTFAGKFVPADDGSYIAETEARSPTIGNAKVVWKKVRS